ncbi:ROBO4 protein, partial [Amazona guildingii]|nr:ROBO4 protein [Amazona guildingii]
LRDNFRLQPSDLVATVGQVLELDCVPPSGHPEPHITWKKDGVALDSAGDRYVVTNGKLRVAPAQRSDSGLYVCVAANAAGRRESRGARVSVLERLPTGRRDAAPQDLLAVRLHLDNGTVLPTAAVRLRWRMLMRTPVMVGYMVLYRCLVPTTTSWVQHDAGKELSTVIPALRRGYKYEFKVRPYTGGTQGLDSNSRYLWIPEEVPSVAPRHVTVVQAEVGNSTVVVSWEPPPPEAHNGIIRGYKVWLMAEGWQRPTNRTVDGGTHHLETLIQSPGAQLCVRVAAFNGAGLGIPSNATCSAMGRRLGPQWGVAAGSTGLSRVLRQPIVIAATGSLLWLALLILLLLLCQRRTSQDAAMRRRLVAADTPCLGGPWKPVCAPQNRSSSSSLLGSDGRDPSSEPHGCRDPSRGDTLGCAHHPAPQTQRPWSGSAREVGAGGCGGIEGQWEVAYGSVCSHVPHEELQQVHSTPLLTGGPGHGSIHGSRGEWGPDLGLEWPQQRGHDGDTGGVVAAGDWQQLPVFSTPKPHRGSTSLASCGMRSPVPPPHGWHPPVTRGTCSWAPGTPRTFPHPPQDPSLVTRHSRDVFLATRYSKDTSPATKHPRDMSPVTSHLSPAHSDGLFTQQRVAKDLEMDQDTNCPSSTHGPHCVPCSPASPTALLSISPSHTYGYIYGPPASELGEEEDEEEDEEQPAARGSPVGSLLNGWGSVSEDNFTSARCSLVSSCDGSFLLDASFARALAVAVDGLCFGLDDID